MKEEAQEKDKNKSTMLLDSLLNGIELQEADSYGIGGSYDYLNTLQQQWSEDTQQADVELGPSEHMETSLMTSEEHQRLLEAKQRREAEAKARAFRFQHRKSIEEILHRILNGDIFDMFQEIRYNQFPKIPLRFGNHQ